LVMTDSFLHKKVKALVAEYYEATQMQKHDLHVLEVNLTVR